MDARVKLIIERRDGPDGPLRRETFEVEQLPMMTVLSCLEAIERRPVTADGEPVAPVAWDCSCLEEACGACVMLINGVACQACSARVAELKQPIELRPLSKFPVIRDLCVDRSVLCEALARAEVWLDRDGSGDSISSDDLSAARLLAACTACGACTEACPSSVPRRGWAEFSGPHVASQVRRLNLLDADPARTRARLARLEAVGGLAGCGNAQNCNEACPQEIPLVEVLASLKRDIVKSLVTKWFRH